MSLSAWIVLGLLAGLIYSNIAYGAGPGVVLEVVLASVLLIAYYAASREVRSD